MKKKHRDIIIDGEKWAWRFNEREDYEQYQTIQIWKNKKIVFEKDLVIIYLLIQFNLNLPNYYEDHQKLIFL